LKGTKISRDRYTLNEPVAKGGFATIYRAQEHTHHGDIVVAVKVSHSNEPACTTSIIKESEVIQKFNHDNIVALHAIKRPGRADVFVSNAIELPGSPAFFVMEYLSGGTLDAYLQQVSSLPIEEAAAIAVSIARALYHIHEKGFAHNDLKLENIVFRELIVARNPYEPVLVDFGIATRVSAPNAGSLYIMPPEQLDMVKMQKPPEMINMDASKVDVWGLGVVLYRMLGGQLPFSGRNEKTLTQRINNSRPTSLQKLVKEINPEMDELIIDGCLAKNPAHRLTLLQLGQRLSAMGNDVVASQSALPAKNGTGRSSIFSIFGRS